MLRNSSMSSTEVELVGFRRYSKIPSVCMYVCLSSCPALTTPTNFLIFGMKVGDHQSRKVTEPDLPGKFKIGVFWGIQGQKWPKNGHFAIQLENETYKFADFLHEGRGTLVEKTGVGPYSGKNQNWGFFGHFLQSPFQDALVTSQVLVRDRREW